MDSRHFVFRHLGVSADQYNRGALLAAECNFSHKKCKTFVGKRPRKMMFETRLWAPPSKDGCWSCMSQCSYRKHYQTVDHHKWEPQVGRGLFGIHLLILHFKFQFSKSIKSSIFHIFLNLTYSLRKNLSFPKCPKITHKFTENHPTVVMVISIEILRCLKQRPC